MKKNQHETKNRNKCAIRKALTKNNLVDIYELKKCPGSVKTFQLKKTNFSLLQGKDEQVMLLERFPAIRQLEAESNPSKQETSLKTNETCCDETSKVYHPKSNHPLCVIKP